MGQFTAMQKKFPDYFHLMNEHVRLQREIVDLGIKVMVKEESIQKVREPYVKKIAELKDVLNANRGHIALGLQKYGMPEAEAEDHASMLMGEVDKVRGVGFMSREVEEKKDKKPELHWAETMAGNAKPPTPESMKNGRP